MDGLVKCQSWILVKLSIKEIQFYRYVQGRIQDLSEGGGQIYFGPKYADFGPKYPDFGPKYPDFGPKYPDLGTKRRAAKSYLGRCFHQVFFPLRDIEKLF